MLVALRDARTGCGAKAGALAAAIAAGLPVPDGFVIVADATVSPLDEIGHAFAAAEQAPLDPVLTTAIADRAGALGPQLAVRSSSEIEDRAEGAAAGIFASIVPVPVADAVEAVRAVRASALAPLAIAYARGGAARMHVIVQRFVAGERVTIYTRPAGKPHVDEVWVQRGTAIARTTREDRDPLVVLALAAERAIGAIHGADVELVADQLVQVRPLVHPTPRVATPPPPAILAALRADGRRWTWDVAHDPDPLSVAQRELVELVEAAGFAPWEMRLCGGYLYSTPRAIAVPPQRPLAEVESELAAIAAAPPTSLDDALARYLAFYRGWALDLVPHVRAMRGGLEAGALLGARPSAVERTLLAAAHGLLDERAVFDQLGVLAPSWDVAVPTYAETPERVREAIRRLRVALPPIAPLVQGDRDVDLGERDDHLFARAQWLVRRALCDRARVLGLPEADSFWLPFAELRDDRLDIASARRRASAARHAAERARRWTMPIVVGGAGESAPIAHLRGIGFGPVVVGRVRRIDPRNLPTRIERTDIVVVRAVTPALAVVVAGAAGLVSETGGLLDHGAAMARELGMTCVVGCAGIETLVDGALIRLDGDRGTIEEDELYSSSSSSS